MHKHAHQLEHAMTPLVVEKLSIFLGKPEYCPHGTPLPGISLPESCFSLDKANKGSDIEIAMIGEELEDSVEIMKILQEKGVMPGRKHKIENRSEVMKSITLENESGLAVIPLHVAQKITVIPCLLYTSPSPRDS